MKRCLILTGGSVDYDTASVFLEKYSYDLIIAADHGMDAAYRLALIPDFCVGDFDSADPKTYQYFREQEKICWDRHPSEKDETDTELAILIAISEKADEIHVFGASGTRLDHTLGAIALLQIPMEAGVMCYHIDGHNRITMVDHGITIKRRESPYRYLSLIPYSEQVTGLCASGVKYPLDHATMVQGNTLGISNEIIAEEAVITFEKGKLIIIESVD